MTQPTKPTAAKTDDRARFLRKLGVMRRIGISAFTVGVLLIGCGGWAATAQLVGAVVSQGLVVVDGHVKKIQHRDGGIVAAIFVKNGDRVREGDTLVKLDSTQIRAELGIVQSQLLELRGRHARLSAERDLADEISFPADFFAMAGSQSIVAGETRLFNDNRKSRTGQQEQLQVRIGQFEDEAKGLSAQAQAKQRELELIQSEFEEVKKLYAQKLAPITRVYALEREATRLAGEHGSLLAQGARALGQISEIRMLILGLDQSARTDAQRDLRDVEARISELAEREIAAKDRLQRMDITSPRDGLIHELAVHTIGGVISPSEPIMVVVPEGAGLSIELKIAPGEIDQLHVGQDVRLRFTSFNQRTTPELNGQISYVSADISQDARSHAEYYSALVKLDDIRSIGGMPVVPGMPVEAFISTAKRTALSYFLKPLTDNFSRALRED